MLTHRTRYHVLTHSAVFVFSFRNSVYHEKKISWNNPLPLTMRRLKFEDMCEGLYVECGPRTKVDVNLYHWHVDILVDGKLAQSGVLIKDSWVLVKRITGLKYARDD